MKALHPIVTLGPVLGLLLASTVACSTPQEGGQKKPPTGETPSAIEPPATRPITEPMMDPRALGELKKMSDVLAAAHSMAFEARSMTPHRSPNGQWLHFFKTARVEMQRPNQLFVRTGGDAFPQRVHYNGHTFAIFSSESKLYAEKPMTGSVDSMLAQAAEQGDYVFPFADVLVSDPNSVWNKDLESAVFVGESNRDGRHLIHLAFVAKEMDWEVWEGAQDHLPYIVYVKYKGEERTPSILVEFSKWHFNHALPASHFSFKPPRGAIKAGFKAPTLETREGERR